MSDIRKDLCPFPEKVYLGSSHIKQNINGHHQIVGMFITDKPDGGDSYEYTRAHDVDGLIAEIEKLSMEPNSPTQMAYNVALYDCLMFIRKHFGKE